MRRKKQNKQAENFHMPLSENQERDGNACAASRYMDPKNDDRNKLTQFFIRSESRIEADPLRRDNIVNFGYLECAQFVDTPDMRDKLKVFPHARRPKLVGMSKRLSAAK